MMFSTNPFPHIFPPSNSDSFHDQETDDLYINPFLSGDCFPAKENSNITQELGFEQQFEEYNHLFWSEVKNKRSSKKDHHSKIQTAKGPRDRRVRLSIEVAKKFFYLQDLLEVDKASKTLDWLFQKSKVSIDELIMRKKQSSGSTVTDQSEVVFMETGSEGRKEKCGEGKRKRIISRKYKSGFSVSQSRAEARARARERTKEKLNIKKLDYKDCCSSNLTLQSSFWNLVESQNDYDLSSKFTALPKFTDVVELQPGDCATI